jgi:hypothetical protein
MSDITSYSEKSFEFTEMIRQANGDSPEAAFAAGNCYRYGSSRFCQDWYKCFVLNETTEQEYAVNLTLVETCLRIVESKKNHTNSLCSPCNKVKCCEDEGCCN